MKKILLVICITGSFFASAQGIDKPWLKPLLVKQQIQMVSSYSPAVEVDPQTAKLVPAIPYGGKDIFSSPPVIRYSYFTTCYSELASIEKQVISFTPGKLKELREYLSGKQSEFSP